MPRSRGRRCDRPARPTAALSWSWTGPRSGPTGRRSWLGAVADQVAVAEDQRGLVGHAAAWQADGVLTIGPVVARDDAAARALIQALAAGEAGPVRVDLPARNASLSAWARERGLVPASPTPLMVHRGRALPGARDQLYAPATLALG
jgi:hypothetical protein